MRILLALTSTLIGIAALFYCLAEGRSLVDAIYFSVMTIATVGFGDLTPKTTLGKLFTVGYVVCGLGLFVDTATAIADGLLSGLLGTPEP